MEIKITEMDPIWCRTDLIGIRVLEPILTYKSYYWKQGPFAKKKVERLVKVFQSRNRKEAFFFTGYLPRIYAYLNSVGYTWKLDKLYDVDITLRKTPRLIDRKKAEITFRPDQLKLIDDAFTHKRGMIKAPTGSGKSILMMGIVSRFAKTENILILCHNASIVKQLYGDFTKYFSNVVVFTGDTDASIKLDHLKHRIVISTIQTFSKIPYDHYSDYFSCIMVDEAHRVSSVKSLYGDVLQNALAPYRFGFTATLPTMPEAIFAYEGLIGPMVSELSINEAADLNILAKPKIKIIKAGYPGNLRDIRDYHSVYDAGITNNQTRNSQIVGLIQECMERNETVLIFVSKIAHGVNIESICLQNSIDIHFVQGSSDIETRERVRNELNAGTTRAVISTTVWKEGINIPNLNNVINAAGGKSEIATLQSIGRGLRKTSDKSHVTIYDFFDPGHPYLISHFGERLCLYMDMNWL